jgi:hypothetical protein
MIRLTLHIILLGFTHARLSTDLRGGSLWGLWSRSLRHPDHSTLGHNRPYLHHNTPCLHHNTPFLHHNTPYLHHNTPYLHHNTPHLHHNTIYLPSMCVNSSRYGYFVFNFKNLCRGITRLPVETAISCKNVLFIL